LAGEVFTALAGVDRADTFRRFLATPIVVLSALLSNPDWYPVVSRR